MKHFSSNLTFLRKSRQMKQAEIKSGLDIERTTWNNYETGKSFPNLQLFAEIAKYFDINEADLLHKDLSEGKVLGEIKNQKHGKVLGKISGKIAGEASGISKKPFDEEFPNTYNLDFSSLTHLSDILEFQDKLHELPMLFTPHLNKGLHFRFVINTDKMSPTINPGDYVIATYQPKALNALSGGQIVYLIDNQHKTDLKRVYYSKEVLSQFDEDDAKTIKSFDIPNAEHTFLLINDNKNYRSKICSLNDFKIVLTVVEVQTRLLSAPLNDMRAGMETMLLEYYRQQSLNVNEGMQGKTT